MKIVVSLILLATLSSSAMAQLAWQEHEIDVDPTLEAKDAVAHFSFRNTGKSPVTITNVETSCPCTTAQADKTTYQPGEKGMITATYSIPIANGLQEKQIFVTIDKEVKRTTLDFKINLPEFMTVTPASLSWKLGDKFTPKTLTVEMTAKPTMNVVELLWGPGNIHFTSQLKTVKPHKKYLVTVTPVDLSKTADETLRIETDYPAFQAKALFIPIHITAK